MKFNLEDEYYLLGTNKQIYSVTIKFRNILNNILIKINIKSDFILFLFLLLLQISQTILPTIFFRKD